MRREPVARAFAVALLSVGVGVTFPVAAPADDRQVNARHERPLQQDAKKLDADAARASSAPEGQRRVTERIAKQFNVDPSIVTDLRKRKLGFGGAAIALALSQELMKRDASLTRQAALDTVVAQRQAGKGWRVIARDLGLKIGHAVSAMKETDRAKEHIAGTPDKVAQVEKPENPATPEPRPEKPAR